MSSNVTSKVLDKGLWKLSLPMIFEQAIVLMLPIADTLFLGQISDNSAGAVGAITPIIFMCTFILHTMSVGGASVAGQYIGANDYKNGNAALTILIATMVVISMIGAAVVFLAGPAITTLMGLPAEIKIEADSYLSVIWLLMLAMGGRKVYAAIINVYGHPKWNLMSSVLMTVMNLALNWYVLKYTKEPSILGIAWATVVSGFSAMAIQMLGAHFFVKVKLEFKYAMTHFVKLLKPILNIAIPASLEPISYNLNMFVLSVLVAKIGAEAIVARTYVSSVFMIAVIMPIAFGGAAKMIIAQLIGKKLYDEADIQLRVSVRAGLTGAGVVGLTLFAFNQWLVGLFNPSTTILESVALLFAISALTEPGRTVNIMAGGALRTSGDGWFVTLSSAVLTWGIAIPLAYVFAFTLGWGLPGVLLSNMIDENSRACLNYWRWGKRKWENYGVLEKEPEAA